MADATTEELTIMWEDRDYGFLGNIGIDGLSYQIVTSSDGQVSWNSPCGNGRWSYVDSIERAKADALQDLLDHRSELSVILDRSRA